LKKARKQEDKVYGVLELCPSCGMRVYPAGGHQKEYSLALWWWIKESFFEKGKGKA